MGPSKSGQCRRSNLGGFRKQTKILSQFPEFLIIRKII